MPVSSALWEPLPAALNDVQKALRYDLFAPPPCQRVHGDAVVRARAVWLGIGLCSGQAISQGLPVDVLAMLLGQEALRRALGVEHSEVLIADSNAIAVGFSRTEVEAAASSTEATLERVAERLSLPIRCVRGSTIAPWSAVARDERLAREEPYDAHQMAQMSAMTERGACVKVGWVMSSGVHDESYFDGRFESLYPGTMAFVYAVCGRALNHRRPRVCPYVAVNPAERILLRAGESIGEKLAAVAPEAEREVGGYVRLLRKIGRAIAQLGGNGRAPRMAELVVQDLLDRL